MTTANWRVGVDIGGTFTDVVALGPGELRTAKTPTLRDAPALALARALAAVELGWADVQEVVHGTTMVTNALVEGRLARTALVATAGFADTIEIGRQSRQHLYHLDRLPKPPPLVPRELRFEVAERMDYRGLVRQPLDEGEIARLVQAVAAAGVESVAVCLLHAYANPEHEQRLGAALQPHVRDVALSHQHSPEAREFERMTTTVLSAGVMRRVRAFTASLEAPPADRCRHHFVHSAGGMATGAVVRERPMLLAMSGPSAGVAAATAVAGSLGHADALTFDMGGTTTDVCLVQGGRPEISADRRLAGHRLRLPMVAVESIGAGGGSIARLVDGALQVGPDSAGADPGPACYGQGGVEPTVTDANLVLGRIGVERALGGSVRLDAGLARRAIRPLALAMGMTVERAALGLLEVAHTQMTRALRRVTVERGVDARSLPLVAYGGAGPMHAVELARLMGIGLVVVPRLASGLSAWGCVTATKRVFRQRTLSAAGAAFDPASLAAMRREMVASLAAELGLPASHPSLRHHTTAMVRYRGQSFEIDVTEPDLTSEAGLARQFERAHLAAYGFTSDDPVVLVALRVELEDTVGPDPSAAALADEGPCNAAGTRHAWFDSAGPLAMPCIGRAALHTSRRATGPLAIEDAWTTVIVPPGCGVRVAEAGHLLLEVGAG